jgi:hypothetical protein
MHTTVSPWAATTRYYLEDSSPSSSPSSSDTKTNNTSPTLTHRNTRYPSNTATASSSNTDGTFDPLLPLIRLPNPPSHYKPPSIQIAMYNIKDRRNNRLLQALNTLDKQDIDMAILMEIKIPATKPIHTRFVYGSQVFIFYSTKINQGGIALVYCKNPEHNN